MSTPVSLTIPSPNTKDVDDEDVAMTNKFYTHEREFKRLMSKFFQMKSSHTSPASSISDLSNPSVSASVSPSSSSFMENPNTKAYIAELMRFSVILMKDIKMRSYYKRKAGTYVLAKREKELKLQMLEKRIADVQKELEYARAERTRKIEYDRVAKLILEYPSITTTKKQIEESDMELERLKSLRTRMEEFEKNKQLKITNLIETMRKTIFEISSEAVQESEILSEEAVVAAAEVESMDVS